MTKIIQEFIFQDLGIIEYGEAWSLQKKTVEDVIAGRPSKIFFCEHPTVLTLGRLGTEKNILCSSETLSGKNVKVVKIDRGGEVTLHAPGQLVVYPVIDLNIFGRDLRTYLYKLEQVGIDLLRDFGILATRIDGQRGLWAQEKKIVSIGIGVRKWVSYHGLGINVNTDLTLFQMIKPCGLDVAMTSIQDILGREADMEKVKILLKQHFERVFL